MSESLQNLGLKQIKDLVPAQDILGLGEDFFIIDVKHSEDRQFLKYPYRSEAYIAIFCIKGSIQIEINLRSFSVTDNTLCISTPGDIIKISEVPGQNLGDSSFYVFAISKEYLSNINFDFKKIFDNRLNFLSNPCVSFSPAVLSFSAKYLDLVQGILNANLPNKTEAVSSLLASVFYVFCGLVERNNADIQESQSSSSTASTRINLLFDHFMSLVTGFHTSERNMSFYASRLGLTPKYLSKLVKQVSGRSGPEWIDAFVILEAKNMLKYTDVSIKEIVFKLNFPNPSVFYKFFKSHTGLTPSEYRNGRFA